MTPAQMRVLRGLSDDWTDAGADGLGKVFMGLVDLGLADMKQAGEIWQRRITSAGRAERKAAGWKARSLDAAA